MIQEEKLAVEQGMKLELSESQKRSREEFRAFARAHLAPHAARWDAEQRVSPEIIERLKERGYLAAVLPEPAGGRGMDAITYGLLTEELGRCCSSVRSLLTVHDMATLGVGRWGSAHLKEEVLPLLVRGDLLGAFALTEPEVGSDAKSLTTRARRDGEEYVLDGRKKWITFGQIADVFLLFARCEDRLTAFLVPADAPGFSRRPLTGIVGTRAAMLAELELAGCRIPATHRVGREGFGFSHVAATCLDQGRYSVAWGSVGIAQACLDATLEYTGTRRQFQVLLREHQLVQRMLTDMIVHTRAARLLCYRAGYLRQIGDPGMVAETLVAKYYASRTAVQVAGNAVQLHGAHGVTDEYPVARYLRDAKVMEIIEGSTQIQQVAIARNPPLEL